MRIFLYLIFIFVFSSCSMFKSKKLKYVDRTIASIEPNQMKVDEIDGNIFVSINFEVYGKHKGNNTFEVKAPYSLDNDVKYHLPYEIIINSSDINCISNSSFKEVQKNYQYRNEDYAVNNKLKCVYEGISDKKIVSITYVFHKLEHIPIEEANPFIHPVSQNAQDATRLLISVQKDDDVDFFDRRLLFGFFSDKNIITIDSQKKGFSYELNLDKKDIVHISAPHQKIDIPKNNEKNMGTKKIKPNGLICKIKYFGKKKTTIEHFLWSDDLQISDATNIKCGLISKKPLTKLQSTIKLKVEVAHYSTLQEKISDYLKNPKVQIDEYIDDINKSNLESVKNYAQRTINNQIRNIEEETEISKLFPYTINKELKIDKIVIYHRPRKSHVIYAGKDYYYLDFDIYATPTMIDRNNVISKPGKVFLGTIRTKYLLEQNNLNLNDLQMTKVYCGKQYEEIFLPRFVKMIKTNEEGKKMGGELDEYKEFIDAAPNLCHRDYSSPIETTMRRRNIQKCGHGSSYDKIVASYDLFEGVHLYSDLDYYVLSKEELPIKKSEDIQLDKKREEVENCVSVSEEKALQLLQKD